MVKTHPLAKRDLTEVLDAYFGYREATGDRFIENYERAVRVLENHPRSPGVIDFPVRGARVEGFQ